MKKRTRLVLADDNPRALRGLAAILAAQPGLQIVGEASQGVEALALIETLHPQAALLDVRMPVMDGILAAHAIKSRWPQTRVILISLYADYQQAALEAGADAFLVKGCPANELISSILGAPLKNKRDRPQP
jgi:YesN/AraC family two-component response regulator